jgi:hypothetical protein
MNRHERRRAAAQRGREDSGVYELVIGRGLIEGPPEMEEECFVCGGEAKPWDFWDNDEGPEPVKRHGFVRLTHDDDKPLIIIICKGCFDADDLEDAIMWKVTGAPNLKIADGGAYTSVEDLKQDLATDTRGIVKH